MDEAQQHGVACAPVDACVEICASAAFLASTSLACIAFFASISFTIQPADNPGIASAVQLISLWTTFAFFGFLTSGSFSFLLPFGWGSAATSAPTKIHFVSH